MSKIKDKNATKCILEYLCKQNRPYSAIDIFNNLHKECGKPIVVRALEQLTEEGKVKEKIYGKQKLYFPDQSQFVDLNDTELDKMDKEVLELTNAISETTHMLKNQETALDISCKSLTTKEAEYKHKSLAEEISNLKVKLSNLQSNIVCITPEVRDAIYKNHVSYTKEWRKRKRMVTDATDAILESYPKSKSAFFEEVGLETDGDLKIPM